MDKQQVINVDFSQLPVLYTDNVLMTTNPDGIVFSFAQPTGLADPALRVVARVGMSREHAKKFLKEMGKLLALTEGQVHTGKKGN